MGTDPICKHRLPMSYSQAGMFLRIPADSERDSPHRSTEPLFSALRAFADGFAGAQGGFNGPGRYEITNVKSGKVLDLDRNDQTSVIQFSSRGTDNQVWESGRPAAASIPCETR
jgi:hypothetical protein